MPIGVLDLGQTPMPSATWQNALVFTSFADLLVAAPEMMGLYVVGGSAQGNAHLLRDWRNSPYWFKPLLFSEAGNDPGFSDGALDFIAAQAVCERTDALRQSLQVDPRTLQFDERLLYFLYLREPHELLPLRDRNSKHLYRYPEAEAIAPEHEDAGHWITSLARRELLQPTTLFDRTRHCRSCSSAHLHYLDVCPQCRSMEIHAGESVHCFTCGHVAPNADFRQEGHLECPQCQTRLRHVGVDYDRPLTRMACATCHHAFIEADVVVRCLDCGVEAAADMLDVREVRGLRLSAYGRAALRAGQLHDSFAALDTANYVVPNYFRLLLDWAITTQNRHKELAFSLVMIECVNASEVIESHGAARTFLILDELSHRLREMLRTSDLTTRTAETMLWVFLPFSQGAGFAARVEKLLEQATPKNGGVGLRARIRHAESSAGLAPDERAASLMERLQSAGDASDA